MFDLRSKADEAIAAIEIEHIHVLQGAFMVLFDPGLGTFDYDKNAVSFWGDGTRAIEVFSLEDTARMVAQVAPDRSVESGKFAFDGDRVSIKVAAKVIEAHTGRTFNPNPLGAEAELRSALAAAALDASNPFKSVMLAQPLYMLTRQTAMDDLQNEPYPDLRLESFSNYAKALPKAAATSRITKGFSE